MYFSLLLFFLYFCSSITASCPDGSVGSYTDQTICYYFEKNKTSFMDAEGICREIGGHLISIHDMFENIFLGEKANSVFSNATGDDFWSGATNLLASGNWSWMDGTSFNFNDWDKGQPQNNFNCGAVKLIGEKWVSDDCDKSKPFICATKGLATTTTVTTAIITTTTPKSCFDSWTYYDLTGFCYRVFVNSTWLPAEDRCKVDGAHLASIHSIEEAQFVADLAYYPEIGDDSDDSFDAFIGLYTEDGNKQWKWTDGTPYNYTNWAPGEPNNPGVENYGQIYLKSRAN